MLPNQDRFFFSHPANFLRTPRITAGKYSPLTVGIPVFSTEGGSGAKKSTSEQLQGQFSFQPRENLSLAGLLGNRGERKRGGWVLGRRKDYVTAARRVEGSFKMAAGPLRGLVRCVWRLEAGRLSAPPQRGFRSSGPAAVQVRELERTVKERLKHL